MKITEIYPSPEYKIGRVKRNGVITELREDSTILYLTQFGFDIEIIKPANTKRVDNPDVLMMGAIWEIKGPESSNKNTIKNRFRKASRQATKIIFDLRGIKNEPDKVEKQIINLFSGNGRVRRMMIIRKDGTLLDITK